MIRNSRRISKRIAPRAGIILKDSHRKDPKSGGDSAQAQS